MAWKKKRKRFTVNREMNLSSHLWLLSTLKDHKTKGKFYICVSDDEFEIRAHGCFWQWEIKESNFSMLFQEDWNLVNNRTGRLNVMPVLGEMVIECNRLHHALFSNWWNFSSPNIHGFPYLCMPLWVDQTPSWNNPFHRHKRLKLPHGYNCEVDICCSSGCEVRLWRTQVCTLSKEIRD